MIQNFMAKRMLQVIRHITIDDFLAIYMIGLHVRV